MRKLPHRLQTIANYIETGASVADIGTDHGKIPVYLALRGTARRIIASDISINSLYRAQGLAEGYFMTDKIEFINAPGLTKITAADIDTLIISGLGGETIISILHSARWPLTEAINGKLRIILQAQTKHKKLIEYLHDCGCIIKEEKTVYDGGRKYIIILV